jgi:hypothetical protein
MSPEERGRYLESPPTGAPDIEEAHQAGARQGKGLDGSGGNSSRGSWLLAWYGALRAAAAVGANQHVPRVFVPLFSPRRRRERRATPRHPPLMRTWTSTLWPSSTPGVGGGALEGGVGRTPSSAGGMLRRCARGRPGAACLPACTCHWVSSPPAPPPLPPGPPPRRAGGARRPPRRPRRARRHVGRHAAAGRGARGAAAVH